MKTVLTIAGSDPSGGAGIQADLKVLSDLGVKGLSAITALTAQTEEKVIAVYPTPADILTQQLSAAAESQDIDAIKIGMIGTAANVWAIELFLRSVSTPYIVVDPVFNSSNGVPLLEPRARNLFKEQLMPLATLLTPNLAEAEYLSGMHVAEVEAMEKAAKIIYDEAMHYGVKKQEMGVLVKGGHLEGDPIDVYYNGREVFEFEGTRLTEKNVHGTGCVLSSAIAAYLAKGNEVKKAISLAREYLSEYIKSKS